ncbi:hypothetical protein V865_005463 [Kwoniella europaea PYCC6329]|uniref:Uncharacterized protein n=1 Tax=Kwoniella europaea PYCC6329 TaxID=1423913 RepID=A0AAX4KP59_9TREE
MKDLVAGWKLESFTWHSTQSLIDPGRSGGLYLSDETRAVKPFFPPNIPRIRAFNHHSLTDQCGGSGESGECKKALRDILIHLTLEDWSDEVRNEKRKVDLTGYPCLEKIGTDDVLGAVMKSQQYLEKEEAEVERTGKDWEGRREWIESNFRIMDIDEAERCVCCGKK